MTRTLFMAAAALAAALSAPTVASAELMIVGVDGKFAFDGAGHRVALAPGHDSLMVFDLADPAHPALVGTVSLENSVVGPPSNLAITPDQRLALVANSLHSVPEGDGWRAVPADELFVVDLTARPPRIVSTVTVGAQPSGLAIDRTGTLALVANRAGKSVTVLSIRGQDVRVTDTVPLDGPVTSVAITPDGKQALAVKTAEHKVAVLSIDNGTVRPTGYEMPVGLWPWQVTITPDGRFGLVGDTGNQATSTGNVSPVAIIDLSLQPPRVVDFATAGDSVEGLAASPRRDFAAATILQGSYDAPKDAWYRHAVGRVTLLRIDSGKVSPAGGTDVGAFPEGVAFSQDGDWVYAGNFASNSISVLHLEGGRLVDTHADIKLPGPPAALRVGSQ